MNVQEFDTALSDLETRVDRLRALYENWFRGYEKMEPSVARKDVERRVYGLRKELPRNTALRFRYHQLYQRYTTLATYWQRTARQIEEGTHRLQIQRMKRRRPDDDLMRTNIPPADRDTDNDVTIPPPSYELNLDESLDVQRLLEEADIEQVARAIDVPGPFSTPPPGRASSSSIKPMRGLSTPAPLATPAPAPAVTSARFARPSLANDVAPLRAPVSPVLPQVIPAPAAGAATGVPKPPPLKIPLPKAPGTGTMPGLPVPRIAVKPGAPGTGTLPGLPPPRVPAPPPVPVPMTAARPAPPGVPRVPPPAAPAPPQARPAESSNGISEQRLRRLYDEYAAARRKNNEGDVRFETLAGTIQKMLPDLSKKHQGKQIDFEVVLKDGRVGLKPKAT
ncbi:MAG: hypothetical protein JWN04_1623 [Myxococcaceae bacterium]|nr:hypothetical protein [Myxococcaceae bacterium]